MIHKKQCLIITKGGSDLKRLIDWLYDWDYELHFAETEAVIMERAAAHAYDLIFLHPSQWQLHLVKQFRVLHSFGLISAARDCFTEYLDEQGSIHIQEPFRPSQYQKLERQLRASNMRLLADCMLVKSQWCYYRIPIEEIDLLERDKVPSYTRICYGKEVVTIFDILTAWERILHCTANFERIGDNLLVAKKHQGCISNDYFIKEPYRIRIVRRYIDTYAYRQKKKNPVIDMHLQGVATQPVIT